MIASARALLDGLSAAGVTLTCRHGALFARPAAAVDASLAQLLRRFKPELVNVFARADRERLEPTLAACARCDLEFAILSTSSRKVWTVALCPFCEVTESQSVTPLSCHETRYLAAQSAHVITVQTVQNVEKETVLGQLDSSDSSTGYVSCARAR